MSSLRRLVRDSLPFVVLLAAAPAAAAALELGGLVLGPDSGPLPGAWAEVEFAYPTHAAATACMACGTSSPALDRKEADAAGSFVLTAPRPGLYRVRLGAPGHLTVALGPQAVVEDLQLEPARLEPVSLVSVHVLGPDGRPAGGVDVRGVAQPAKGTGGFRIGPWQPEERHARTGADGRADLPLAEGEVLVVELIPWELRSAAVTSSGEPVTLRATREGLQHLVVLDGEGQPAPRTLVWAEGAARATAMTADDGKLALAAPLHDLRLELEGAGGAWASARVVGGRGGELYPVDLEPPVVSTGRVLDGITRAPVAEAVVWCHEAALPRWTDTGPDGRFRLPVLHPALCQLEVVAPGYFPLHRREPLAADATLLLDRAATLAGLVVDRAGAPVAGAELRASATELWPGGWPRAWTDPQGRFRFTHLPARAAGVVLASLDGYRSSETAIVTPALGEAAPPLRLVLEPGEAVAVGRVVGPGGAPLEGVSVRLVGGSADRRTRSDPDGRFRFAALAPGSYRLLAQLPGFGPVERGLVAGPQAADWGTLALEPAVTLAGRVTDGEGRPLERALVFLRPVRKGVPHFDRTAALRTDADGRFRFADLTRGELYFVSVTLTGYADVELEEVEVPRAEPLVVVLPRP